MTNKHFTDDQIAKAKKAKAKYMREYRRKNRDKINAYQREYRRKNKDKAKEYEIRHFYKKYLQDQEGGQDDD